MYLPFRTSSTRFPWPAAGVDNYVNNVDYNWQLWFSGNVTKAKVVFNVGLAPNAPGGGPGLAGFSTEACCDYLQIGTDISGKLSGNLDNSHTVAYVSPIASPLFAFPNDNFLNVRWYTDYSVNNFQGWTIDGIKVKCDRTGHLAGAASAGSRLQANSQRDGVLLGTGDIRHFTTILQANRPLLIHLRQESPPSPGALHADYDLFASFANTTPGPGALGVDFDWESQRGIDQITGDMQEDTILIQPTGVARNVYFSVYAWTETPAQSGGFRVYDNTIGKQLNLKAGADFDYKNGPYGDQTQTLLDALYATTGAFYQATDGTALIVHWELYNRDTCTGGPCPGLCNGAVCNACGGAGCKMLFTAPNPNVPDECIGFPGQCNDGRVLHRTWQNGPGTSGYIMSHEFGHCIYGLSDEYLGGVKCGHGIMSGAPELNVTDYCTGTTANCTTAALLGTGNHYADCVPAGVVPPAVPLGNWRSIQNCYPDQVAYYTPFGTPATPDPETWNASPSNVADIWKLKAYTTIAEHPGIPWP